MRVDVTARGQLQSALEKVEETLGPVNILINNAGIVNFGGILEQTPEDWDQVIETNLNACFLLSKLVAQSMVKQRQGKIINIASMYALFGAGFVPAYSASKGALVQLSKSMAIELAPFNIQVNAIVPGYFETEMTEAVKTMPLYQGVIARTPAGRWGNPDELAGTAVFLASRAFDFCHRCDHRGRWRFCDPVSSKLVFTSRGDKSESTHSAPVFSNKAFMSCLEPRKATRKQTPFSSRMASTER
jgi:2-dehydro-3-deoxy-D-gluconate 5-dehydrogenase